MKVNSKVIEEKTELATPKIFISYSWSSDTHKDWIRDLADRLISDGVQVVLDQYDLKEGQDKYAFMERMVTDPSVSHVLIFCDQEYAQKADSRKAGVGTESQIISQEIYEKVEQTKFIPIGLMKDAEGNFIAPIFLKSRIGFDFSTPELEHKNYPRLLRRLFDKPLFEKPKLGKPPTFVTDDIYVPIGPARTKLEAFKRVFQSEGKGSKIIKNDFLDTCFEFIDKLRIREQPDTATLADRIVTDFESLTAARDVLVDYFTCLAQDTPNEELFDAIQEVLERLIEVKSRPKELNQWNDAWFEAHALFVYETFIYCVAVLVKFNKFETLRMMLTSNYLLPPTRRVSGNTHGDIHSFYTFARILETHLTTPDGRKYLSPAVEIIKRNTNRNDIDFSQLVQADLLILLTALTNTNIYRWYPQFAYYAEEYDIPELFLRASQHRHFRKIAVVLGLTNGDEVKAACEVGFARLDVAKWSNFWGREDFFKKILNLEKLDSIN